MLSAIRRGASGVCKVHPDTPVPSALDSPSLLRTGGMPSKGSRGPDKDDRRSWEVERIDAGRIRQVGHGPWELVLI